MMETLKQAIINYLPAFACGFTYIICTFKCLNLLKMVNDNTSLADIRALMRQIIKDNTDLKNENAMLKKVNNDLEAKVNKIFDFIQDTKKEGE